MKSVIIIVIFLIWSVNIVFAQAEPEPYNLIAGEKIALDQSGNIYVVGSILTERPDAKPDDFSAYNRDILVIKFDSNGEQLWQRTFGTDTYEWVVAIAIDSKGDLIIQGYTGGNLAGLNPGTYNLFLSKYSSDGEQKWLIQIDNSRPYGFNLKSNDEIQVWLSALKGDGEKGYYTYNFDAQGNELAREALFEAIELPERSGIYLLLPLSEEGFLIAGIGIYKTSVGGYMNDSYVARLSKQGELLWVSPRSDGTIDAAVMNSEGIVYFLGWGFDSSIKNRQRFSSAVLSRYDAQGTSTWLKMYGDGHGYEGSSIAVDSQGNLLMVGFGNGDLGGEPLGVSDAFVLKVDSEGNELWADRLGTKERDGTWGVTVDAFDNIYITGHWDERWENLNKNSGIRNNAGKFLFLAKYNSDGEQIWLRTPESTP